MKAFILAGGYGTRLSEETAVIPKPMVEIGGRPILWHIMKIYSHYGINDFVVLLGYKGYVVKEYFANYFLHQSDVTFDLANNHTKIHKHGCEPWRVTLVETGQNTLTGGRLLRARDYVDNETFMLTYGDGVSDVNLHKLLELHQKKKAMGTMTSVLPEGRFGAVDADKSGKVCGFSEKLPGDGQWINAGFFVFEPEIFDYLTDGDKTTLESTPLEAMAKDGRFYTYRHRGFWKPMDTLRDKNQLEKLWSKGAPWKLWRDEDE